MKFKTGEYVVIRRPPYDEMPAHWVPSMMAAVDNVVEIQAVFESDNSEEVRYTAGDWVWRECDVMSFPFQAGCEVSFTDETRNREPAYLCLQNINFGRMTPGAKFEILYFDFSAKRVVIEYRNKPVLVDPYNLDPKSVQPKKLNPNIAFRERKQKVASPFFSYDKPSYGESPLKIESSYRELPQLKKYADKLTAFKDSYGGVMTSQPKMMSGGVVTGRVERVKAEASAKWKTYGEIRDEMVSLSPSRRESSKPANVSMKSHEYFNSDELIFNYDEALHANLGPPAGITYTVDPSNTMNHSDMIFIKGVEETTLEDLELKVEVEEPKKEESGQ